VAVRRVGAQEIALVLIAVEIATHVATYTAMYTASGNAARARRYCDDTVLILASCVCHACVMRTREVPRH
jgi:cytochrome bd-type quinol oxidase subunit 2